MTEIPVVTIEQGTLRGAIRNDFIGGKYYSFQGIPFGQPPIGELRFKAPKPAGKWTGILNATKEGNSCYSRHMFNLNLIGSENCLFLNVYTKQLYKNDNDKLQPVMVWIHGGGFVCGSGDSDLYGPDFLITENVVIVTINYRLGLLGFLSLEDPSLEVPGNAGMKDMVLALKWVQSNIKHFNGNPNNVTIFGQSAGGAAVHLLMLSPMTKGLFHRCIAQSGCALNPWIDGIHTTNVLQQLLKLDNDGGSCDERTLLKILQNYTVEQLHKLQETIIDHLGSRSYGIVVENKNNNCKEEPFLSEHPIDIITSKRYHQVPFMIGYTTAEGMCFELFRYPNPYFEEDMPAFLGYDQNKNENDAKLIIERIRRFYYGGENNGLLSIKNRTKRHTLDTDLMFLYGIYCSVRKHAAATTTTPVYFYRISLQTSLNIFKKLLKIKEPGTSHCDDLGYLFKNFTFKSTKLESDTLEFIYIKRFIKLWTNFAHYGNPTPDLNNNNNNNNNNNTNTNNDNNNNNDNYLDVNWEPVRFKDMNHLNIGATLTMMSNPEPERMKFWDNLYSSSRKRANYCL